MAKLLAERINNKNNKNKEISRSGLSLQRSNIIRITVRDDSSSVIHFWLGARVIIIIIIISLTTIFFHR